MCHEKKTTYVSIKHKSKQSLDGELQLFTLPIRKEGMYDLYIKMSDHIGEIDHPLSTRAWALQERILPRRTVLFGKHQMYFECDEGLKGENGLNLPLRYNSIHAFRAESPRSMSPEARDEALELWRDILRNYGPSKLTIASDKLPAISGIAKVIAERRGGEEYLAGLWRCSLIANLFWEGLGVHRVSEYRAPSWSWASVDGVIVVHMNPKWEPLAEIINCKVELKGKNPYGEVKSGWIRLRAPLVPLIMIGYGKDDVIAHPYENNPMVRTQSGDPKGFHSRFDFAFAEPTGHEEGLAEIESLKGIDIFALVLASSTRGVDEDEKFYHCLIVRPAERDHTSMQRQGFVTVSAKTFGVFSQLQNIDEQPITNLI
jgi:hypothetical protein